MQEMDCVEVIVEKEKYAKDGVHKGMQGWICDPRSIDGTWLVNFPHYGEKGDIATESIKETDMKLVPCMNALLNELIYDQYEGKDKGYDEEKLKCVEIIVEKECYVWSGIHKGMQGKICYPESPYGEWLVRFSLSEKEEKVVFATVDEKDMKIISCIDCSVNERIRGIQE